MISPGERFNAFSEHRMIRKGDGATFEIGRRHIISPVKHSYFTLIHLLNRSITNVPWLFWLQVFITFVQLASSVVNPFNTDFWNFYPAFANFISIIRILLRFVPFTASEDIQFIIFGVYCIFTVGQLIIMLFITSHLQAKKDISSILKVYFYYSYFLLPLMRGSMSCMYAHFIQEFFLNKTFASFLISVLSLVISIIHIFNVGFVSFAMGSGPYPNMSNPLAIWAPNTYQGVVFDIFLIVNFAILEFSRFLSKQDLQYLLIIYSILIVLPCYIYSVKSYFYIHYLAYEYMCGIYLAIILFELFLVVIGVLGISIDLTLFLVVWLSLPGGTLFMHKFFVEKFVKTALSWLDSCNTPVYDIDNTKTDDGVVSSVFDSIPVKSPEHAVSIARVGCVLNHKTYIDLSFLNYCIALFPEKTFEFIHLAYLLPDQYSFVQNLIEKYLENTKPTLLEETVLFQIITGIQESSNELTQAIIREISHQNLQSMKCSQIITKVWSSCYKGDITQMSKHAFTLNKLISQLRSKWESIVLRYPFSKPVLKEYIKFLMGVGCEHKKADAIQKTHPALVENNVIGLDQEINGALLHQSVEEATERRPISSIFKLRTSLTGSVFSILALFIFISTYSYIVFNDYETNRAFIYDAGLIDQLLSHCPNIFDDVINGDISSRETLYQITRNVTIAYNIYLNSIHSEILRKAPNYSREIIFNLGNYTETRNSTLIDMLDMFLYFSHSLTYIPANDSMYFLVTKNIINANQMIDYTISDTLETIDSNISFLITLMPYVLSFIWGILLLILLPLIYVIISNLTDEVQYLYSLYFSIPRSTIAKFIDINSNSKGNEKKNLSTLMTSSFAHHTRTGGDQDDQGDHEKNPVSIADNFKILVNDNSTAQSVLPPYFITKASTVFFVLTGVIALLSSILYIFFVSQSENILSCFYTLEYISERTSYISLLMHGLTTSGRDYGIDFLHSALDKLSNLHNSLLFGKGEHAISASLYNSIEFQRIHFKDRCEDSTNDSCKSLLVLFDSFVNSASNVTSIVNGSSDIGLGNDLRTMFNKQIFPLMIELHEYSDQYIREEITFSQNTILLILVLGLCFLIIVFFVGAVPMLAELDSTISSVKLPLKFIDPIDLADLPKLMQYLQGECDYGRHKLSEQQIGSKSGSSFLNIMQSPFAVFEGDFSLLFANNAFYGLLSTSREATIGLPLVDIFSPVIPFKQDDNHPFNSLLDTVQQLQRGVAAQNFVEIVTDLELSGRSSCPIMIRLVGLCDQEGLETDDKQHMKATQYIVFLTDLSGRKSIEEKLKYESDISSKLIDSAIPRSLLSVMSTADSLSDVKFGKKPVLMFSLRSTSVDEDMDDDLLIACSLFIRTASDINSTFTYVTKLVHKPPQWVYISGLVQNDDDLKFSTGELAQFAIHVVDVFTQTISQQTVTISAFIHVGEINIIPIQMELPTVEVLGRGYETVQNSGNAFLSGKIVCTSEVEAVLKSINDVILKPITDKGFPPNMFEIQKGLEISHEY